MKILLSALILIIIFVFTYQITRFLRLEQIGKKMSRETLPFERHIDSPNKSLLIAGDSLAVGVGSADPTLSIAGLIASDYPNLDITNMAVSGSKIKDVLAVVEKVTDDYDIIMIQVGGNDVVAFTSIEEATDDMRTLLGLAKTKSDKVIFFSSGSVGYAPIFPHPFDWIYTNRTVKLYTELKRVAEEKSVIYVDLFYSKQDDPFGKDIEKYYAPDYFHVSESAYQVWYQKIKPNL